MVGCGKFVPHLRDQPSHGFIEVYEDQRHLHAVRGMHLFAGDVVVRSGSASN